MFEELNTVEQKLAKIISQNDAETAAKIMFAIMKDCVCAEVVGTPNKIYEECNKLVDFATASFMPCLSKTTSHVYQEIV